jgi:hypothetical protein
MTKLELQNKIAVLEKNISKTKNPTSLAILQKNIEDARKKLAALEQGTPAPAPSGGSSELEKLYAQRETLKKGLSSSNPVVQKSAKAALPKVEARIAELEGASPAPAPAKRMPKPKAETPAKTTAKRGRKPKAETPAEEKPKIKRGRKPKVETPVEEKPKIKRGRKPKAETPAEVPAKTPAKRGRKPKAPTETPAKAPAKRGRPALPKGAKSQEVSIDSLTKLANSLVEFCIENGISNPSVSDLQGILNLLDKGKALKFAKGGKISKSGSYLSKWQIAQIITKGGMKVGQNELISGVWLKKKGKDVAQMRMGGEVGYFVIDDDILDSGKSIMLGTRRVSAKNKKFQGVFKGKMVGGLMKVYDYDDEMWKVVNPDEWQQAYAEGGEVSILVDKLYAKSKFINDDWHWELKILELLQDNSIEAYQIYMQLNEEEKESVLQELYEMDNDMGSDGDGTLEQSEENLQILLEDAKNGKRYAEGGGVGGANSRKTINVLEKNYVLNSDIKNFKVEYEIGVFPSGKKDSHNLSITRYSDELGGSQKSVLKILSKSEAKRIFNEINKSNVKDFFQMLGKKS